MMVLGVLLLVGYDDVVWVGGGDAWLVLWCMVPWWIVPCRLLLLLMWMVICVPHAPFSSTTHMPVHTHEYPHAPWI